MDRFDIICVLRQGQPDEQKDWEYIGKKNQIRRDIKAGVYDGYDEYLKKYLKYARTFNPNADISEDAVNMLDDYWVKMGQTETDDRGRPRKLEGLYRIAVAISKIKLKNQVDVEDAIETMQHYNVVLLNFSHLVPVSQSPNEVARETCISILQEFPYPIASKELFKTARDKNEQVKAYVGNDLSIETNWKLRKVYEDLLNDSHVILVQEKPTVFKWKGEEEKVKAKASRQASEVSDVSEAHGDYGYDYGKSGEDKKTRPYPTPSYTSDTSDSTERPPSQPQPRHNVTNRNDQDRENIKPDPDAGPGPGPLSHTSHSVYQHLIETESLPNIGQYYRCKEHPDIWNKDLNGLEISHFQPFHSKAAAKGDIISKEMIGGEAGADLDEIMRTKAENSLGGFSNAKATLRFYLKERKRMIDEDQHFDLVTAQGLWYLVEPYIPTKANGEFVKRKNFVSYIREICKNQLHCRREDLKIVAGGRADLYFDGQWTSISWDNIEDLSDSGTDGTLIEKDGMSRIFEGFVDPYGIAVINTRGKSASTSIIPHYNLQCVKYAKL